MAHRFGRVALDENPWRIVQSAADRIREELRDMRVSTRVVGLVRQTDASRDKQAAFGPVPERRDHRC